MQPTAVLDSKVETNVVPAEQIRMGIDPAATAHLMSVLTNLYSDPVTAVLREYSTNAWDAHIMAGHREPIVVNLPNRMSPYLRIQDFGIGLSLDDLRKVYSQYGASTKRGDNSQNGMLGLGSKSALTYTSQFSITSVKDGTRHIITVSPDDTGIPVMSVISSTPTTDRNGVTIEIPANRMDDFTSKANNFYSFWDKGTVLLNGAFPGSIRDKAASTIGSNMFTVTGLGCDYVVMANVAYPIKDEYGFWTQDRYGRQFGVVMFIDAKQGQEPPISHTPNREALFYTKRTIATIEAGREKFKANFQKSVEDDIDSMPSAQAALSSAYDWNEKFYGTRFDGLTYKGVVIPSMIKCPTKEAPVFDYTGKPSLDINGKQRVRTENVVWHTYTNYRASSNIGTMTTLDGRHAKQSGYVIVTDYPFETKAAPGLRAKIKDWALTNGYSEGTTFILCEQHPDTNWFCDFPVVSYDTIKAIRVGGPSTPKAPKVLHKFDALTSSGRFVEEIVDFSKVDKVLYISPTSVANYRDRHDSGTIRRWANVFQTVSPLNIKVIILGRNRWDKFERDYKNVSKFGNASKDIIAAYENSLTTLQKELISYQKSDIAKGRALFNSGVALDDPDVVDFIKKVSQPDVDAVRTRHEQVTSFVSGAQMAFSKDYSSDDKPFGKYNLWNSAYLSGTPDKNLLMHYVVYINAAYAAGI